MHGGLQMTFHLGGRGALQLLEGFQELQVLARHREIQLSGSGDLLLSPSRTKRESVSGA